MVKIFNNQTLLRIEEGMWDIEKDNYAMHKLLCIICKYRIVLLQFYVIKFEYFGTIPTNYKKK